METTIRKGKTVFYGDSHFPRGIARSGHFSKREAMLLEQYGNTFQALAIGELVPENEEEKQFVAEVSEQSMITLSSAKLWKKYQAALSKVKRHHSFILTTDIQAAENEPLPPLNEALDEDEPTR